MRTTDDKFLRLLLPAGVAASLVVAVLSAVNAIAALTQMAPHVGDIVAFDGNAHQTDAEATRLIVHRPGKFGCVLDLNVLRRLGGSLVVESELTPTNGSYRVHWAGERTSADTGNCGTSADLVVDAKDLDLLALSAGGYGIDHKRLPLLVGDDGM